MLLPHPESDLSLNLMVVGTDIVSLLKIKGRKNNYVLVETILVEFLKKSDKRTPDMFINALVFLFAMGIIESKEYKIKLHERKIQIIQGSLF